ncbi:MAG: glutaminase [Chloroflexi bacterium]|nr:glutaminase [Chloroflexota bacterium]MBK7180595.1 glutaminase [Chloroflexota bacterium]MBK7917545.1 glutaminase [Chloroflexota bacterium]MBK8934532.1 glutaminase [Chloroflexota bacterium]MBP6804195.1 glutaminase [Chloroflexota bacterium]
MVDYPNILAEIYDAVQPLLAQGKVADYIPELAHISPHKFGMAVQTSSGELHGIGDADEKFSVQSVSKAFTLTMAMRLEGDAIWRRVGREPSGTAFNSLVQLEYENGIPRNPFINAGAMVVTDMILSHHPDAKQAILDFVRLLSGTEGIGFDTAVAQSEKSTGYRNAALAYFLKSFGNLRNDPEAVLDTYFHHCALSMSCVEMARAGMFLANDGRLPWDGQVILSRSQAKYVKALMLTCGTYDAVGDFAYRVGLPGKSGVGGGILAVMPDTFSVCVWSPGLNAQGNSLAGTKALELFTTLTEISIF